MQTIKTEKFIFSLPLPAPALFHIAILYLLMLAVIFSYIPFDIEYAEFTQEGNFHLSPAAIEYAWLNPPLEDAGKMVAGVDWSRIYLELGICTLIAGAACLYKK